MCSNIRTWLFMKLTYTHAYNSAADWRKRIIYTNVYTSGQIKYNAVLRVSLTTLVARLFDFNASMPGHCSTLIFSPFFCRADFQFWPRTKKKEKKSPLLCENHSCRPWSSARCHYRAATSNPVDRSDSRA